MQDKVEEYLASARAAEKQAAQIADPLLRESFQGIAQVYREMAERARALPDDDDATLEPPLKP
jgi:hypothetical protein